MRGQCSSSLMASDTRTSICLCVKFWSKVRHAYDSFTIFWHDFCCALPPSCACTTCTSPKISPKMLEFFHLRVPSCTEPTTRNYSQNSLCATPLEREAMQSTLQRNTPVQSANCFTATSHCLICSESHLKPKFAVSACAVLALRSPDFPEGVAGVLACVADSTCTCPAHGSACSAHGCRVAIRGAPAPWIGEFCEMLGRIPGK